MGSCFISSAKGKKIDGVLFSIPWSRTS